MPDAHFFLHHHPQQEVLADLLLSKLKDEGHGNPFHKSTVLVRNQGMGTWLNQRMAKQTGLAMQVDFPQPSRFQQSVFADKSPNPDDLQWRIYEALPALSTRPAFSVIQEYLGGEQNVGQEALKRYQLSGHIAALFDKYLLYRPKWIEAWSNDKQSTQSTHEPWQRELWQHLHKGGIEHWSQSLLKSQSTDLGSNLPSALHVFGISNFAPIYVNFLYLLSQQIPVHVYWLNPVGGYWGDGPSKRAWILAKAFEDPEILMHHNPLLASFGRMGREFVHTLYGGENGNYEIQEEDIPAGSPTGEKPQTRLQAIQRSLFDNEPFDPTFKSDDDSVSIHSCYTPLRELETLKTHLLRLAEDKPLDAGDVLVLCPDIETYAPAIEAVFGSVKKEGNAHIPYQISDRNAPLTEPTIGAVIRLFSLHTLRFTNREALALLSTPAIAANLDLNEGDISTIEEWVQKNGIRWGFDSKHVDSVAPGCVDTPWTWRDGLDRMLLGYAMPQCGEGVTLWNDILPFNDVEGGNTRILAALCGFVDWCAGIRSELESSRPLEQWVELTRDWINTGFDKSATNQQLLQPLFKALEAIHKQSELLTEPIPVDVFAEHLQGQLGGSATTHGFLNGSVTFCETKPMRAIPARAICLLGMNHDSFPRRGSEVQFDLTKEKRIEGDRSTRDDDVYFFLETILSARESLFISYIGRSIKDGEKRPPSTSVQTLIDHTPGLKDVIHEERLHSFDPYYFDASSPISHDQHRLEAARILAKGDTGLDPQPHLSITSQEDKKSITIDHFIRSFTKSAAQFLRHNLQAQRSYLDSPMDEDEALNVDGLTAWQMKSTMLRQGASHYDDRIKAWRQEGIVPPGEIGTQAINTQLSGIEEILEDLPHTETQQIAITIDGLTIYGNVPISQIDGHPTATVIDPSENKPARQLTAWIYQLLASHQLEEAIPGQLLGLKKNKGSNSLEVATTAFAKNPEYAQHLASLVKLYQEAQTAPMHHFPDTAETYWSISQKEGEADEDFEQRRRGSALGKWEPSWSSAGEAADEVVQLIFDTTTPFTDEFLATSELIWKPLLDHRITQ